MFFTTDCGRGCVGRAGTMVGVAAGGAKAGDTVGVPAAGCAVVVEMRTCFPLYDASLAWPLESCFAMACAWAMSGPDTIICVPLKVTELGPNGFTSMTCFPAGVPGAVVAGAATLLAGLVTSGTGAAGVTVGGVAGVASF